MNCKYYDCGWCYAPNDIKTNATQGECTSPENCSYLKSQIFGGSVLGEPNIIPKGQKKMLDQRGHLECEIKEIQLEIEQKAKAIGNLKGILERKEQQLREMQPQTLYKTLLQKTQMARPGCEQVCNIVRRWLIDHTVIETEDEEKVTFTIHKEQLQTPK